MPAKPLAPSQVETIARIRRQLSLEFRNAGWGSRRKAMESIGVSRAHLDNAFKGGSLKLGFLLQVLDEIGVSLEDFLWSALDLDHYQGQRRGRSRQAGDSGVQILRHRIKGENEDETWLSRELAKIRDPETR